MDCKNCPYYWADTEEYIGEDGKTHLRTVGREHCQYNYNDGYAPCETSDYDYDPLDCEEEYDYD